MNKIIQNLERTVSWNLLRWEKRLFDSSNLIGFNEIIRESPYWEEYSPPKSFYKSSGWFRATINNKINDNIFEEGFELKLVVDDSAYLWFDKLENEFFEYEKTLEIKKKFSKLFYLYIVKTAGLIRIIDTEITPSKFREEIYDIRDFILSLKSIEKIISFDTFQSSANKRVDTGIDNSKIDKRTRKYLQKEFNELLIELNKEIHREVIQKNLIGIYQKVQTFKPHLKQFDDFSKNFTLTFASNAHIDAAWLWRKEETKKVCDTTFSAVDKMMSKRNDFTYSQSSAVYYNWIEENNPTLFEKIKKRIRQKRWEVIGGSWVEPDCNLIAGESWIQQLLIGKKYFQNEFGIDENVGFNPDSFGYNANLPMIYKHSGINTFITQKINWNENSVFPHRIFLWQSKDGSKILSYFLFDYVDLITDPFKFINWLRQFEANTGCRNLIILFGIGDHGGGPTSQMFKKIDRLKKLYGLPNIIFDTIKNYLKERNKELNFANLPVWEDELYLEFHQGTYTTQSILKEYNRKLEAKLTTLDKLQMIASISTKNIYESNKDLWQNILFNQFHDILPGSSIQEVVIDAIEDYKHCTETAAQREEEFLETLLNAKKNIYGNYLTIFNPFNWGVKNKFTFNYNKKLTCLIDLTTKEKIILQKTPSSNNEYLFISTLPSFGYKTFKLVFDSKTQKADQKSDFIVTQSNLENKYFSIEFDNNIGQIKKVVWKKQNKIVATGNLNKLILIEDKPKEWDAWNIDLNGKIHEPKFEKFEIVESNSFRKVIRFYYSFIHPEKIKSYPTKDFPTSFFEQDVILYRELDRIDFETRVDWWENHMLLKILFPQKNKAPKYEYEIPFGFIERNSKKSEIEKLKTEVSALRWVQVSGNNFGVVILNQSKYGYDVKNNTLRMSLLRSPKWPDSTADRGKHSIKYSLMVNEILNDKTEVIKKGYEFNQHFPYLIHNNKKISEKSFIKIKPQNIILSAAKKCEDENNSYILHLYETKGKECKVKIELPKIPKSVFYSNFVEEGIERIKTSERKITIDIKAFSLVSIKITY